MANSEIKRFNPKSGSNKTIKANRITITPKIASKALRQPGMSCLSMPNARPDRPIATKAKQRMKTNVSRAKPGSESMISERIIEIIPRAMSAIRGQADAR